MPTSFTRAAACAAAAIAFAAGLTVIEAPVAGAVCGSVGGRYFDVSGCADPLNELNDALPPPPPPEGYPPPPPAYVPPPPPPRPNVTVCANVGRRISVSGCV